MVIMKSYYYYFASERLQELCRCQKARILLIVGKLEAWYTTSFILFWQSFFRLPITVVLNDI